MTGVDSLFRYSCCSIAFGGVYVASAKDAILPIYPESCGAAKSGALPAGPNQGSHADAGAGHRRRTPPFPSPPSGRHDDDSFCSSSHNQYELPPSNLPALISRSARLPDGSCWVNHTIAATRRYQFDIRALARERHALAAGSI
jgi:hypothetical protein